MKLLAKIIAGIVILLLLGVIALVMLVDPNSFKPRIEAIAKEQGVALQMKGDLGWDFWPSIGVAVSDVSVAAVTAADQPIAEIKNASLMLALLPLLSGDFKIDHVLVDGASAHLHVDANGKGNWEAFSQAKPAAPATAEAAAQSGPLKLEVERISLTNIALNYADAKTGQQLALRDINLIMTDVNLQGKPFAAELSWILEMMQAGAEKLQLQGSLKNRITLDEAINTVKVEDGTLQVEVKGKTTAKIELAYALDLTDIQNNLTYQGNVKLTELNIKNLLAALGTNIATAHNNALEKFSLATSIAGTNKKVSLDNLAVQLDKTHFTGSVGVTDFATSAIKLSLTGDEINLDDYLPPESTATATAPAARAEDTPLPLEALRDLNINAKFILNKMLFNKMALEKIDLQILIKNGMVEQKLTANAYAGAINVKSQLDARSAQAQVQFDAGVEGLELAPLLKDMAMDERFSLSGAIQARAIGSTQGASVNQLFKSMRSNMNFSGAQVRLAPINLEQQFCRFVNLVNRAEEPDHVWHEYTEMTELSGSIKWRDEIITIDTFKAGVEKLQLGSTGKINLATDEYDIFLPFKVIKSATDTVTADQVAVTTSATGCSIGSSYWLERGMSLLRCKGSFAAINPLSDCRPDKEALVDLTKDYAEYKLREKHGAKIDAAKQKAQDKKQELLDKANKKLGGEGEVTKPKDLLNNFLKKKLGGDAQSSSAASSVVPSAAPATEPATQ